MYSASPEVLKKQQAKHVLTYGCSFLHYSHNSKCCGRGWFGICVEQHCVYATIKIRLRRTTALTTVNALKADKKNALTNIPVISKSTWLLKYMYVCMSACIHFSWTATAHLQHHTLQQGSRAKHQIFMCCFMWTGLMKSQGLAEIVLL